MKRLVIYFHYDPAGCIDTACRIAVQAVQKYGRVVFVTNGTLAPADRVWVRQSGAGRIERENVGFDVGAYRVPASMPARRRATLLQIAEWQSERFTNTGCVVLTRSRSSMVGVRCSASLPSS